MEGMREGRHLAAIMFVDMVGYSARMQKNEPRAIAAVRDLWGRVRPLLAAHGGREVDLAGDGMLMEFPGALAAVRCALAIHASLHASNPSRPVADRVLTRAGVHLGDIEHSGGRIYGEGVNIAARLLPLAPAGAVVVSPHVRDQLHNVLERRIESLGVRTLKNIKAPMEIWCIAGPDCPARALAAARAQTQAGATNSRWSFGTTVLDERTRELTVDGRRVELERKTLNVLIVLLQRAGAVVTKDALLEAVWPGRIVSESVLSKCIAKLRRGLRDEDQALVQTMHGIGYRLAVPVTEESAASGPARGRRPNNLPALLTTLVGRERSVRDALDLLRRDDVRLVTFTGCGGVGKTRLGLQTAADLLADFEHGAYFVDLATTSEPGLLAPAIASALGVREPAGAPLFSTLKDYLRDRQLLLLLDNFEQLVEAAPLLAELLLACPRVKAMVTSRERLGLRGEHVFEVPSLVLPEHALPVTPEALGEYSAVALFIERARMVAPQFALTDANAGALVELCRRLDGLPLAIELAAARSTLFTPADTLARLNRRFEALGEGARDLPARQRTLWTTIDWSYQLLDAAEQSLFRRLAVFCGGFTLTAAEAVCTGEAVVEPDVPELLTRLVTKSLARAESRDIPQRYRMLETIREFGRQQLSESGEAGLLSDRHASFYGRLAESPKAHVGFFLPDVEAIPALARLETENDNLSAALAWSRTDPMRVEGGLRLANHLHWFWFARGRFTEARSLLEPLVQSGSEIASAERARALVTAGYLAGWQGDFAGARVSLDRSVALLDVQTAPAWRAFALMALGSGYIVERQLEPASVRLAEAMALARQLDDAWLIAFGTHWTGQVAFVQANYAAATAAFEESIHLCRQLGGNKPGIAHSLMMLGRIATAHADDAAAVARYREAAQLFQEIGDPRGTAYVLFGLAGLAAAQQQARRATRLLGAAEGILAAIGYSPETPHDVAHDQLLAMARTALGEAGFATALAEGRSLTLQQALADALAPGAAE